MSEVHDLIDRYYGWLKEKTAVRRLQDWTEITTPFVDRHNDMIQIYIRRRGEQIILTDDGNTINDLESSGCLLDSPRRKDLLQVTLNGFGVRRDGNELTVTATPENFPLRKHSLIQAVLAVNDLFYLARSTTMSLFLEDVMAWLDVADVRYIPNVKLPGASGFDHVFDFAIPRSRSQPERLIRALSNPSRESATNLSFAWTDTSEARQPGVSAFAILNDNEKAIPGQVADALSTYGIRPIAWSNRDQVRQELAA